MIQRVIRRVKQLVKKTLVNLRYERVFVLGDSHAHVFKFINNHSSLKQFFDVMVVGGATAMGMVNPNSKTDCLNLFRGKLKGVKKHQKILILLGEVDTGFVIWYRALKHGLSVESQFERSLENYFEFVRDLLAKGYTNICLMSAPLPTIKDNHGKHGEIANLRSEVKNSIEERTDLTLEYNKRLAEFATQNDIQFLGLDTDLLGKNGIIDSRYLNSDPLDHHCDHKFYSEMIVKRLADMDWVQHR